MKPGLQWKLQDAGDATVMKRLPHENCIQEWNPAKREMYVVDSESGRGEPSKSFKTKVTDKRHGATGFSIFPTGSLSCFGPVITHDVPISLFWDGKVYSMPLHIESINQASGGTHF